MVKLLKIKRRDFIHRDSIPILVSRTVKTSKFKLLYFRNETCFGAGNLYKDLFSFCLQPRVNRNSQNPAFLSLQFDDVTVTAVKTINAVKREMGDRSRSSCPPNDGASGAPFFINEGRVGHFKTKNLENRLKPKTLFLREDISSFSCRPKKQEKIQCYGQFLFFSKLT